MKMTNGNAANPGDFVTFTLLHKEPGDPYGGRQGLYIGENRVMFETTEEVVLAESISCKVPDRSLFPWTEEWVMGYRAKLQRTS